MRRRTRIAATTAAGMLGVAAAAGVAVGDDDLKACVDKRSGDVRDVTDSGRCTKSEVAFTIKGSATKRGGTLTINGVPFRQSRGNVITINGVPFQRRGQTLTINGTAFRTGTLPRSLTINGNSFRSGTLPNTITINGTSFRSSGQTLTINGTAFGPGAAAVQGPPGPPGPSGPAGEKGAPPGVSGPAVVAGPVVVAPGAGPIELASGAFTSSDGKAHRLMLVGGFSLECVGCTGTVSVGWDVSTGGSVVFRRRVSRLGQGEVDEGVSVSDVVVSPAACGPCTYSLRLTATTGASGSAPEVHATDIRLSVIDLGPTP